MRTYHCEDPEDPLITNAIGHEAENERPDGDTKGDQQCPNTHVTAAVFFEGCLHHDRTANGGGRRDEKGHEGPASSQRGICGALGTADVTHQTADEREEEDRPAPIPVGQRLPEQRRTSKDGNLQRGQVTGILHSDAEFLGDVKKGRDNAGGGKCAHASVKRHEDKVGHFLRVDISVSCPMGSFSLSCCKIFAAKSSCKWGLFDVPSTQASCKGQLDSFRE